MYRHVALFAGLGGFVLAAQRNGVETVFINEMDDACCLTLRHNFPSSTVFMGDVREVCPSEFPELNETIDILSAGFPCQSFSVAGENLGFDDERGKLFFEIPRICGEMANPPKVLLLENVPNLKLFDGGARLRVVINELRKAGYWVNINNAQILDSYEIGDTAQRRERLFIVATHSKYFKKNKFIFPEVKKGKKNLWKYINKDKRSEARLYLDEENKYARMIRRNAELDGTNRLFQIRRVDARSCPENVCPTLTANMGGGGHNVPFLVDDFGVRKLSVDELMRLQCIEKKEFEFPAGISESSKLSMIGNAICTDVADEIFKKIIQTILEEENVKGEMVLS
ncbi:DNA (cytosine-5-)-methyltransferase [Polynucleobacter sp. MWH-UH19D]|uniref:DNA cytosine methyltransferase n=1 Tax=Polynucleobacter sp. MWH-UH19D TaxID=1855610 RepID=UPI003365224A